MPQMNATPNQSSLALSGRTALSISGVTEVSGFDEALITLKTTDGELSVEGEQLHITLLSLEEGRVDVQGRINALIYSDAQSGRRRPFWRFLERKSDGD